MEHARMVEDATGQDYLAADFAQFPIGVRLVLALIWQQDANIFTEDGTATINTEEAAQRGHRDHAAFRCRLRQPAAQLRRQPAGLPERRGGGAGQRHVGRRFLRRTGRRRDVALSNYYAADFPTLFDTGATWADSHMWAIPSPLRARERDAALQVLAFINDHNIDWARTGHMAVRSSVVESAAYTSLPHRDEYAGTAAIARDTPPSERYGAIQDVLNRELQAIWLTDKPVEDALADAELEVQDLLDR